MEESEEKKENVWRESVDLAQQLPLARSPVHFHMRGLIGARNGVSGLLAGPLSRRINLGSFSMWKIDDEALSERATGAVATALLVLSSSTANDSKAVPMKVSAAASAASMAGSNRSIPCSRAPTSAPDREEHRRKMPEWSTLRLGLLAKLDRTLLPAIAQASFLRVVVLEACALRPSQTAQVCQLLETAASLTFLSLRLNPALQWHDVFQSLGRARSSSITLDLGLNSITDGVFVEGVSSAATLLPSDLSATSVCAPFSSSSSSAPPSRRCVGLDMSSNGITASGIEGLSKLSARCCLLTSLDLSGQTLTQCGGSLAGVMRGHAALASLGLDRCDVSASDIVRALKAAGPRAMRRLSFAGNMLTAAGVKSVCGAMAKLLPPPQPSQQQQPGHAASASPYSSSCTSFAVSPSSALEPQGHPAALGNNDHRPELDLSCNDISADDPTLFATALTSIPTLHHLVSLDLTMMHLCSAGLVALGQALAKCATAASPMALETLWLGANNLGVAPSSAAAASAKDGIQFLARALRGAAFPCLRVLSLPHNALVTMKPLCTLLEQCSTTLCRLDLRGNPDALYAGGMLEALVSVAMRRRGASSPAAADRFEALDILVGPEGGALGGVVARMLQGQLHIRVI